MIDLIASDLFEAIADFSVWSGMEKLVRPKKNSSSKALWIAFVLLCWPFVIFGLVLFAVNR